MHKKLLIVSLMLVFVFGLSLSVLAADEKPFLQKDAHKLFINALGSRIGLLDANRKSGFVGTYEYISSQIGTTTIYATKGAVAPNVDLFKASALDILDWFKAKFLPNTNNELSVREKEGIRQAMESRYNDLCASKFIDEAKILDNGVDRWKAYQKKLISLDKIRRDAIKTDCDKAYNVCIGPISPVTSRIRNEVCSNARNMCVNGKWTTYYNGVTAAYTASYGAAETALTACTVNRTGVGAWNGKTTGF